MKILKNRLFIFILGGIIFSSITAFAVTTISADKITYTDKNSVERTVDTVLDDLYKKAENFNSLTLKFTTQTASSSSGWLYINSQLAENYKYFQITELKSWSNASCSLRVYNTVAMQYETASTNNQYQIDTYDRVEVNRSGGARCDATVKLYN